MTVLETVWGYSEAGITEPHQGLDRLNAAFLAVA